MKIKIKEDIKISIDNSVMTIVSKNGSKLHLPKYLADEIFIIEE